MWYGVFFLPWYCYYGNPVSFHSDHYIMTMIRCIILKHFGLDVDIVVCTYTPYRCRNQYICIICIIFKMAEETFFADLPPSLLPLTFNLLPTLMILSQHIYSWFIDKERLSENRYLIPTPPNTFIVQEIFFGSNKR